MNSKKITFGVGIALVMLLIFTAPAAADNIFYIVPQDVSGAPGEEVTNVMVMLNASDVTDAFDAEIWWDLDIVNVTATEENGNPAPGIWMWWGCGHHGNYFHAGGMNFADGTSGVIPLVNITLMGNNTGISALHFDDISGCGFHGNPLPETLIDGTFTCVGEAETFEEDLVSGWNLVSLPLTPEDNGTSAVLGSIPYDAVKSYNAATNQFEDTATMDPGIGYFVHMTDAGTWAYEGDAYVEMTADLSQGLNCIGWVNETGSALPDALDSIAGDYNYVARWNAGTQSYEVYVPGVPSGFSDFSTMDRGLGYFIAATTSCTLMYP